MIVALRNLESFLILQLVNFWPWVSQISDPLLKEALSTVTEKTLSEHAAGLTNDPRAMRS